ncbi:MAG: DegV family protein [Anaerolineales bacterium]|nr:DegV family protein [Anaerolineales bacterium]
MKLGIVTDSTADLPAYLVEQYQIQIVPSILILEGKEYADGIGISREDFYNRLPALRGNATTAAPSIGDFLAAYRRLFDSGCEEILSVHIPEKLSAMINNARQAALEFPNQITVVDSGSLSMGIGFQVLAAAEAADLGLKAALKALDETRRRTKVFAALDTMEYLRRSGRVSGAVAKLGGALSIKPVIELRDGDVKPMAVNRTTRQADDFMLTKLLEMGEMERLAILHTNAEDRARHLMNGVMERARMSVPRDVSLTNVTAVIGTHLGPNALGFAAVKKR